jgi:SsrA-binding protein
LAHRGEIDRWRSISEQQHLAIVPLQLYFKDGRVKVLMGLGRGRKTYDKRKVLAKRDADLEARRAIAAANRQRPS